MDHGAAHLIVPAERVRFKLQADLSTLLAHVDHGRGGCECLRARRNVGALREFPANDFHRHVSGLYKVRLDADQPRKAVQPIERILRR